MRWIPSPAANRKELYGITHGYIKRRIPTTLMDRKSILTALAFLLFSLGSLWGQTPASQGDKTVRGRITDEAGEPLIGAAVVNKTNGKGVEAGADGTYSIVIRGRMLLEFSFIGMETVQATFDGAKDAVFNVRMKSSNALNEAVVSAGYGVIQNARTSPAPLSRSKERTSRSVPMTAWTTCWRAWSPACRSRNPA